MNVMLFYIIELITSLILSSVIVNVIFQAVKEVCKVIKNKKGVKKVWQKEN